MTANRRRQIVFLIKQLIHVEPISKVETVYDAVAIADRYLIKLICDDMPIPRLVNLAVTSMMIAAKLQEVEPPLYEEMIEFLQEKVSVTLTRDVLIGFESTLLRKLNFDVRIVSPVTFLERFLRLFGID